MRINSTDIISRATESSTRNTLLVATSVLIIYYFELNQTPWGVLSRDIPPEDFSAISKIVISALIVNHLIKWSSDYYIYKNWFSTNAFPDGSFDKQGALDYGLPPVQAYLQRKVFLESALTKVRNDQAIGATNEAYEKLTPERIEKSLANIESVSNSFADVEKIILELDKKFSSSDRVVRFVVFGWYLALPILISTLAFLSQC